MTIKQLEKLEESLIDYKIENNHRPTLQYKIDEVLEKIRYDHEELLNGCK